MNLRYKMLTGHGKYIDIDFVMQKGLLGGPGFSPLLFGAAPPAGYGGHLSSSRLREFLLDPLSRSPRSSPAAPRTMKLVPFVPGLLPVPADECTSLSRSMFPTAVNRIPPRPPASPDSHSSIMLSFLDCGLDSPPSSSSPSSTAENPRFLFPDELLLSGGALNEKGESPKDERSSSHPTPMPGPELRVYLEFAAAAPGPKVGAVPGR